MEILPPLPPSPAGSVSGPSVTAGSGSPRRFRRSPRKQARTGSGLLAGRRAVSSLVLGTMSLSDYKNYLKPQINADLLRKMNADKAIIPVTDLRLSYFVIRVHLRLFVSFAF